ncbi:PREDICTED: uncharacterized protein LOC109580891 [Amphimedon queenslandica]|uniref:CUB domain-containing protein n=1 Tax=Amphimedon queenslandica TaxID=400682 RepID=A0AAN0IZP1_AMPQE|nr:PREDICTED: uncharacterized protein LOC109580891 [Amphimedon queenslandica]|eukprot:XP_019850007.1 PREDICTED: uncharacterized protein LOC109580891 [Amphimedon queenslandica]
MSSTFSLAISAAILLACLIHVTNTAPAISILEKLTCRHQDVAAKKMWKKCIMPNKNHIISSLKGRPLDLPHKLKDNKIPVMDIPPNSFKCFAVMRYASDASVAVPKCPAVCKLYNPKEKNGCAVGNDLLNNAFTERRGISVLKSPRYGCSNYSRNEICVYHVQMPCKGKRVFLSRESSEIDLAEGDSVEIIVRENQTIYESITGNGIEQSLNIKSSNFFVLFLSEKDATQGAGFKLQFECQEEDEDDEDLEGSGL